MSRDENLVRLRAYAAAHPTDVQVVADTVKTLDELDAYAVLAKLAAAWAAKRSRSQRLHLLASYGVDTTDCRVADLQPAIKRAAMRSALEEGLRRSLTRTQTGLGQPGVKATTQPRREEPFPLERVKRLPPPSSSPRPVSSRWLSGGRGSPGSGAGGLGALLGRVGRRTGSRPARD